MIVYHGSWLEVKNPDLKHSRSDVDFGKGFYVTPLRDQAVNGVENSNGAVNKGLLQPLSLKKTHRKI